MTARTSPWIRPGWHVALCRECQPEMTTVGLGWTSTGARDAWANYHEDSTGHTVSRLDAEEQR